RDESQDLDLARRRMAIRAATPAAEVEDRAHRACIGCHPATLDNRFRYLGRRTCGVPCPSPERCPSWPKERDWKSRTCRKVGRGFESRPLRQVRFVTIISQR